MVMEAASRIYKELEFTEGAASGSRRYLEWRGVGHDGTDYQGITILSRNSDGALNSVAIHHRPLAAALTFSRTLAEALSGRVDAHHFF